MPKFNIDYAMKARPGLTYDWNGHSDMPAENARRSDFEIAARVRMLMREQLDHEVVCCEARDRIMGLSKLNHEMLVALKALADQAFQSMTGGHGHLIDNAYAVIAKAEGRNNAA